MVMISYNDIVIVDGCNLLLPCQLPMHLVCVGYFHHFPVHGSYSPNSCHALSALAPMTTNKIDYVYVRS